MLASGSLGLHRSWQEAMLSIAARPISWAIEIDVYLIFLSVEYLFATFSDIRLMASKS